MSHVVIRLVDNNNTIIDSFVAPGNMDATNALKCAIDENCWVLQDGDAIKICTEYSNSGDDYLK